MGKKYNPREEIIEFVKAVGREMRRRDMKAGDYIEGLVREIRRGTETGIETYRIAEEMYEGLARKAGNLEKRAEGVSE